MTLLLFIGIGLGAYAVGGFAFATTLVTSNTEPKEKYWKIFFTWTSYIKEFLKKEDIL